MKKWIAALLACFLSIPVLLGGFLLAGGALLASPVAASNCITTPGELPVSVPQPLNSIVTQAAKQWGTDPIALAVLFHNENGWTYDREPPPPYGNGAPWASSPQGASGPFQFLPGTFRGYQNANPANQPGNVLDLTDAAYAAAQFLSDLGGTAGTPLGDPANPKQKSTIVNALVSYHSGPAFNSLGPRGREYASKGFVAYQTLQLAGVAGGTILALTPDGASKAIAPVVEATCSLPPGEASEGYPNTADLACAAGTDAGITTTAKGNTIRLCSVRGFTVNTAISAQVDAMLATAQANGYSFSGSAYRNIDIQIALRRQNCGTSYSDIWEKPSSQCSPPTAIPGNSQHEQGNALDLTINGGRIRSALDRGFIWLKLNAARFGLYNLPSEPWHWSVDGR